MLSSDPPPTIESQPVFPFRVRTDSDDALITVFDPLNIKVASGHREVSCDLPAGLYLVRTELAGELRQKTVRHINGTDTRDQVPIYSAAPLANAHTSHEYYTEPSMRYSRDETAPPIGEGPHTSRLLFFVRCANQSSAKNQNLVDGLTLIDSNEQRITAFESGTQQDPDYGWLAFSAQATPGFYRLRLLGPAEREVPIHLFANWEHQIFLTFSGRLLFEGMRHFMSSPGSGFQPQDNIAKAVDTAFISLQSGSALPRTTRNLLLHGKFENPMLGLVGAHVLLREKEMNQALINEVLRNLNALIPGSPDVAALEIIAAVKLQEPAPSRTIYHAPQFRFGFEAILRHSLEHPEIIPERGEIENVAADLLSDSPWTSWRLRLERDLDVRYVSEERWGRFSELKRRLWRPITGMPFELDPSLQALDWSELYVLRVLAQSKQSNQPFSARDVACDLRLPLNTVKRIADRVEDLTHGDVDRILRQFPDYRSTVEPVQQVELAPYRHR
jgi:hypothetical protein